MTADDGGFNLLDEPWIVVLTPHGDEKQVSVLEVFEKAPDLVTIGGEVPTQGFAITRLLLAFLHRAIDGPEDGDDWEELWRAGSLPMEEITTYAGRVRHRFDLFDATQPFFQVPGLRSAKDEVSGLEKIVADVPNGAPYFTTRSAASLERIEAAEAARWLVNTQAFDPSGIKTGAVDDPKAKGGKGYPIGPGWSGQIGGVLPEGRNLRETLLLNLIGREASDYVRIGGRDDVPPWERDVDGPTWDEDRPPAGAIDLYTWQTRRIRLVGDRRGVTGVVLANGDKIQPHNRNPVEPHTTWRHSEPQSKKFKQVVYMPRVHDPSRSVWRGLGAMLPSLSGRRTSGQEPRPSLAPGVLQWISDLVRRDSLPEDYPVRNRIVGVEYGPQSATFAEIVDDVLAMTAALINEESVELGRTAEGAVQDAENVAYAVWTLADNIAQAAGAERGSGAGDRPREALYAALETPYRRWLGELRSGTDAQQARTSWQLTVRDACWPIVNEVLESAGPAAWRGRTINSRLVNVSVAEAWFRASLRKHLALAFATDEETQ
ncbi:type I-E CRISPR-associated protein Cse1/CasA [Actinobacteria bacterium YIM 96077]|uniref:Type I-E CRISPR-associated protein Cse1/CasA n=1 Tax=Phytoactinopolyspora halophila TaxID=1981511 RepID=A0A329QI26_9ACTN|nr:type I-E CRISPR-associated protein Cse1/CasA [Phytoactinopolyspora halophila]AYY12432.1 type I-E CRISPR-associated protein Cse1/CasA [Actinobacteria bacterium YIM 96077]RAW11990.1 type I-E CRISPR-associated protein Cse1/CasA [Phytoactinopolyspora halophila]